MIALRLNSVGRLLVVAAMLHAASRPARPAWGAAIVLDALRDATIFENNPDHASGGGNGLFAGTNGSGSPRRALIAFDLSAIPAGSIVQSADLSLHLAQVAGSGGGTPGGGTQTSLISLHRILAPWGEASTQQPNTPSDSFELIGQGEDAQDGDVTWDARFYFAANPTLWNSPGGDIEDLASSTLSVGQTLNVPYAWPSTAAAVSDVQSWLDDAASNHGWMLVSDDEASPTTFRAFYSRSVATAAFHPLLTITFDPPAEFSPDFDGDNDVDGADFLVWQRGFGAPSGATPSMGDATGEGAVDALDLAAWRSQFGADAPQALATPEPSAALLALAGLASVGLAVRRGSRQRVSGRRFGRAL